MTNENDVIIYSPLSCSKPLSLFPLLKKKEDILKNV